MSVVGIFLACINLVAIRSIWQIPSRYDIVIDENIWAIVVNHVPKLKVEVERLLNEN